MQFFNVLNMGLATRIFLKNGRLAFKNKLKKTYRQEGTFKKGKT